MSGGPLELSTQRLRLRQWINSDRDVFARMNADPQVMTCLPGLLTRDASDALAHRFYCEIQDRGWGCWAVERQDTGAFIGFVGVNHVDDHMPFSQCLEISWRLDAAHWGQGFATEAAQAALVVGLEMLGAPEIVAFTALDNRRSRALMERLGMHPGEDFDHPALPEGHPLRRHCLYRMTQEQWRAQDAAEAPQHQPEGAPEESSPASSDDGRSTTR